MWGRTKMDDHNEKYKTQTKEERGEKEMKEEKEMSE
jgi:hypothetical protein